MTTLCLLLMTYSFTKAQKDNIAVRRGTAILMDLDRNGVHDYERDILLSSLQESKPEQEFDLYNSDDIWSFFNFSPPRNNQTNTSIHRDTYLIGDWDGDGRDNVALRTGNKIQMDFNFDGIVDDFVQSYGKGNEEDEYLVGDWDGDGRDNIAVRSGNKILMDYNFDGRHDFVQSYGKGNEEDQYLVGDWDGDGRDNIAVRRGYKILMDYNFDGSPDRTFGYGNGNSEDQYLVGDWNGDGRDNIAVRRGRKILMDYNFDGRHDFVQSYGKGKEEDEYLAGNWAGNTYRVAILKVKCNATTEGGADEVYINTCKYEKNKYTGEDFMGCNTLPSAEGRHSMNEDSDTEYWYVNHEIKMEFNERLDIQLKEEDSSSGNDFIGDLNIDSNTPYGLRSFTLNGSGAKYEMVIYKYLPLPEVRVESTNIVIDWDLTDYRNGLLTYKLEKLLHGFNNSLYDATDGQWRIDTFNIYRKKPSYGLTGHVQEIMLCDDNGKPNPNGKNPCPGLGFTPTSFGGMIMDDYYAGLNKFCVYVGERIDIPGVMYVDNYATVFLHEFLHASVKLRDEYTSHTNGTGADPNAPTCMADKKRRDEWNACVMTGIESGNLYTELCRGKHHNTRTSQGNIACYDQVREKKSKNIIIPPHHIPGPYEAPKATIIYR